jgi:hypothetical protein
LRSISRQRCSRNSCTGLADLIGQRRQRYCLLARDRADRLIEDVGKRQAVLQRAKQRQVEIRQGLLGEGNRQARFAQPAKPDDRDHSAALVGRTHTCARDKRDVCPSSPPLLHLRSSDFCLDMRTNAQGKSTALCTDISSHLG